VWARLLPDDGKYLTNCRDDDIDHLSSLFSHSKDSIEFLHSTFPPFWASPRIISEKYWSCPTPIIL